MAHYELRISGDTSEPGDLQILALLGGQQIISGPHAGPAPVDASGLSAAVEKPVRGKKKTEPEAGAVEAATVASPATERPSPAVQQTAEQIAHVDPAVLAAQQGGDPASPGSPSNKPAEAPAAKVEEPVVETPAATAAVVETVTGEVTRDTLNAAMTKLLAKTSAAKAQAVLSESSGHKSFGPIDVADYPKVLKALEDAIAAAEAA